MRILVWSHSEATLAFIGTMLSGIDNRLVTTFQEVKEHALSAAIPFDVIILDDQSETVAEELGQLLRDTGNQVLAATKIIHMYTPTTSRASGKTGLFNDDTRGIIKMTKPPRTMRLLQTLADLKGISNQFIYSVIPNAQSGPSGLVNGATRTLYGNILIAEGMQINSWC
jgi:hypothetical protein